MNLFWVLAEFNRADMREIRDAFAQGSGGFSAGWLFVLIGAVLMTAAAGAFVVAWRQRAFHRLPAWKFHKLARTLGLRLDDELVLWWVTYRSGLSSPISLLVSHGARRALARPVVEPHPWLNRRFDELESRLEQTPS